jgi:tellurite methyltransferase
MDLHGWNARYRTEGDRLTAPTPLVVSTASRLPPGRALDLACGTGRDAIWLHEHGWQVTAVDGASEAIARLRVRCPGVDAVVADLERHEFPFEPATMDLVLVCYYLQRDLFAPIKRTVRPGGMALVIVHLVEPGHETSRFSVQPGELPAYFDGWRLEHYREGPSADAAHRRAVAELVAQCPASLTNGRTALRASPGRSADNARDASAGGARRGDVTATRKSRIIAPGVKPSGCCPC